MIVDDDLGNVAGTGDGVVVVDVDDDVLRGVVDSVETGDGVAG